MNRRKAKILYLDDEPENLMAFRSVFRRSYDIRIANTVEEAWKILDGEEFEIIISDQRMPGVTGVEFLQILASKYPAPLRMILTGYSDFQAIMDAINLGKIYYFVTKPWNTEELSLILQKAVETYRLKIENQELEKQQVLAQYEVLKNQVNPHFLFNCLNVLKTLIQKDQTQAVRFVDDFSKLYRSILELKNQSLIPLLEEMELIEKYVHLQLLRFEEGLMVRFPQSNLSNLLVPPFALQVVIENCIKHNIISREKPLQIDIVLNDQSIEVTNNFQPRPTPVESTQLGWSNLQARYKALGLPLPTMHQTEEIYSVSLPIIREID